jgi:hypothetical protein
MVCCHTDESLLIADVRWHVYWVTFVCAGGYVVSMACCRLCSPSVFVCFPHIHCRSMCFCYEGTFIVHFPPIFRECRDHLVY